MNKKDKASMRSHLAECTATIARIKVALSEDDLDGLRRAVQSLAACESQISICLGFITYKKELGLT